MFTEITKAPDGHIPFDEYWEFGSRKTISETDFFRHAHAFHILSQLLEETKTGQDSLSILSVPCSAGLEPLTLMATALQSGFQLEKINITGIDIDQDITSLAQEGHYWAKVSAEELGIAFPMDRYFAQTRPFMPNTEYKRQFDLVFNYSWIVTDLTSRMIPVCVKPDILHQINYLTADIRYPDSIKPLAEKMFDVVFIAQLVGTKLIDQNIESIRLFLQRSVSRNGIVVILGGLTTSGELEGFKLIDNGNTANFDLHICQRN